MAKKETALTEAETAVEAVPAAAEAAEADEPKKGTAAQAEEGADKKFTLDNLAKNCRALFGVSSCTFAGAAAGLAGKYSVEEMKNIIDEWCKKEVK